MSAPIKGSCLSQEQRAKVANIIVKSIAKSLKGQDTNVKTTKVSIYQVGHGLRPFGNALPNDYIDFTIKHGTNEFNGLGMADAWNIEQSLKKTLSEKFKDAELTYDDEGFITQVSIFGKPCKEFVQLNKYLAKYANRTLAERELYIVNLFGKRGYYDESGEREYLCYAHRYCADMLEKAKQLRKRGQILQVSTKLLDDIDRDYSIAYETECYGVRTIELVLN